jgi:hypothetical protein
MPCFAVSFSACLAFAQSTEEPNQALQQTAQRRVDVSGLE